MMINVKKSLAFELHIYIYGVVEFLKREIDCWRKRNFSPGSYIFMSYHGVLLLVWNFHGKCEKAFINVFFFSFFVRDLKLKN